MTPEIKLLIEFYDEMIYTSNLFTVSVEITECSKSDDNSVRTNFITDHVVNINTKILENSSKSLECCAKEYKYDSGSDYTFRNSEYFLRFILTCKLTFKFIGDFADSISDAIKDLKNVASKPIGNLLKDDTFSDFTIIAESESFEVHKNILANVSSVFKTMFTCRLDETKLNSTTFNCKPEIMKHFLQFIYEGLCRQFRS